MIWLLLSIIVSSVIFLVFKLFSFKQVDNLTAIVVNYFVAGGIGFLLYGGLPTFNQLYSTFGLIALGIGFLFIALFNVMANVTQQNGVSVASVTNKMSVIIPIIVAILFYNDSASIIKMFGIALALIGIFLVISKPKTDLQGSLIWPLVLFVGSGILDAMLNFAEKKVLLEEEIALFTPTAFSIAGILGLLYLIKGKRIPNKKSITYGVVLGVPNFFSIFILLMVLKKSGLESSVVFPINNMGVVLLSALLSFIIFKEKLSKKNLAGIWLSVLAIFLIAYSNA